MLILSILMSCESSQFDVVFPSFQRKKKSREKHSLTCAKHGQVNMVHLVKYHRAMLNRFSQSVAHITVSRPVNQSIRLDSLINFLSKAYKRFNPFSNGQTQSVKSRPDLTCHVICYLLVENKTFKPFQSPDHPDLIR